jgi:hypothetical protein
VSTRLFIRTKSIPTAAAVALLSGLEPRVLRRLNGDVTFEFDGAAETALETYIAKKDEIDRILEQGRPA